VIYFVLPVYNEAENLAHLLKTLSEIAKKTGSDYTMVVVNDGSRDRSLQVLEELSNTYPLKILSHDRNQGPGAAFRTGFDHTLNIAKDDDVIITMDADNTHSTKTIGMILASLKEGYEVAIASVFASGGMMIGVPFLRYLLTLACNFLYRILFPVRGVREYTGFYRGYRVDSLKNAREKLHGKLFTVNGFGAMAELIVRLRQVPVFMIEVPMIVRYDQKGGKSKMRVLRTITEHLKIISSNLFARHIA
jgi:dolichol-phosphate mannosyltransferase